MPGMRHLHLDSLSDPTERFELGSQIGSGAFGDVYEAKDNEQGGARVAVKIVDVDKENMLDLEEEYRILRDLSRHPNMPDFVGAFHKPSGGDDSDQLWFVTELCEGGSVMDIVRGMKQKGKRMSEEHIAYILRELIKAVIHLHLNHIMHRDIKGSNILITKNGEIKLFDFGMCRHLKSTMGKRGTSVGAPFWMAPEVVSCDQKEGQEYDNRADVWAVGITAIELGDGQAPLESLHPVRALLQIVRNPPPTLFKSTEWSQTYNDFITECLVKNPEHRPLIMELVEHPFITELENNDFRFQQDLKTLTEIYAESGKDIKPPEYATRNGYLKTSRQSPNERLLTEDLAGLVDPTDDSVMDLLESRFQEGLYQTWVGDVLLILNPYKEYPVYGDEDKQLYRFKARSDNAPHIYAVADRAYQDMMHHKKHQSIIISGESGSGKTTNFSHTVDQLCHLGLNNVNLYNRIRSVVPLIQAFGNASTPVNPNSTRHVSYLEMTFTKTGKSSGAVLWCYLTERWRVFNSENDNGNFNCFYWLYDWLATNKKLGKYKLKEDHQYRYLPPKRHNDEASNAARWQEVEDAFTQLELSSSDIDTVRRLIACILILGEVDFCGDAEADVESEDVVKDLSNLLMVEQKKMSWVLTNYCYFEDGTAVKKRHTCDEAGEARHGFAAGFYFRLFDYVVNVINMKLSTTRLLFGDPYSVGILDLFGFECQAENKWEQLIVNTTNEQVQYHYNQNIFSWEMQEYEEEELPPQTFTFTDNKTTIDALMNKPEGVLFLLDEETRGGKNPANYLETLKGTITCEHIQVIDDLTFSVAHYTGLVNYSAKDLVEKNQSFISPETIELMRQSACDVTRHLFTNQLTKTGNLTIKSCQAAPDKTARWNTALMAGNQRAKRFNTLSRGKYSQSRQMRTCATTFRHSCLELLQRLTSGDAHYVRCIRPNLNSEPNEIHRDLVGQQLRALGVLNTIHSRQDGYSCRISFEEFLQRYQFLAFDYEETVDVTKDNCRLLLVRLKMEGWIIGKTKVFLKYYNEEFLSRLYETQVKKIVKIQAMMRAFLAKRRGFAAKFKGKIGSKDGNDESQEQE